MGSKVTIDQVAAICGVSKTTISRYLNHKYENISAETRKRIEQVITELDYRPNRTAQRLKASRSMLIGCFMDPTPAVLIFTPIFLPIVQSWGMHAVHFGLMMVMNLCVGTLTPPVGAILFAGCRTHQVKIEQITGMLLPFFVVILISLLMITYIPALSMWIPNALGLA